MLYLSGEDAREKLMMIGRHDEASAPNEIVLQDAIAYIEDQIHDWLGYCPGRKEYVEKVRSGKKNEPMRLKEKPVILVKRIIVLDDVQINSDQTPTELEVSAVWQPGQRYIYSIYPMTVHEVTYDAGLDPIPSDFTRKLRQAIWELLLLLDEKTGGTFDSMSSLNSAASQVSSISLPGGISKSYTNSPIPASNSGSKPFTTLDQVLGPILHRHRRQYFYA